MTLSLDQDFAPRAKVRRRRSVLRLRQPEAACAPASVVLMFAAGLMGMLAAASGLAGGEAATASLLAAPAAAASAVTALTIGVRLRSLKERSQIKVVLRTASIWAFFGAVWPLLQVLPAVAYGDVATLSQLLETLWSLTFDILAGASAGAIGGLCGGAAAVGLCVERVR